MKIRSITYFCNPHWPLDERIIQRAGEFLSKARSAYEAVGYEVQTTRLATIPFPRLLGDTQIGDLPKMATAFEKAIQQAGIAYASLGPALPNLPASYEIIPAAIAASQNIFFSGVMADQVRGLDLAAIRACAQVIVESAVIEPTGFANLRFAALANVSAGTPFFPAAYHDGEESVFAIATEAADLAVDAFENAKTIMSGRSILISEIEKHGRQISAVGRQLGDLLMCSFAGIDFSLAPFPVGAQSLGAAFERLGVPKVGLHGSLAAAAILTEAIDRAEFPRTGFSGLMLPVLEDAIFAERAAQGVLGIKDLLLYSAVCGTGLDTLPLPGDTTVDQIMALLLDLSALALRLNKSLTARLMPIPGKKSGDPTEFNFGFFANSRVMKLDAENLRGSLADNEILHIRRR